jgi:hypothetical protein
MPKLPSDNPRQCVRLCVHFSVIGEINGRTIC